MNMGFVIVYVQDIAKAQAFYTDVLGLTVVEAISGPNFVTVRPSSGSLIGLQDKATSAFPPGLEDRPGSIELSFEVDDVDATWQFWQERGVELVSEPVDLPFGRYCMAKDPDGHYLSAYRFNRPAPPAPAQAG